MEIQLEYYLVISLVMMACGVYGFLSRRNTLAMLISIELMLNAADINYRLFWFYSFQTETELNTFLEKWSDESGVEYSE